AERAGDAWRRRRKRLREDHNLSVDRRPVAAGGAYRRRPYRLRREGPRPAAPERDAPYPRSADRDDPAGPDGLAEPAVQHLYPGRRAGLLPSEPARPLAPAAGPPIARRGAHSLAGPAHA